MSLRKLIEAVEAGTATGGPDAMVVPRDMSELIEAITDGVDELWSAFVGAHDGSLDDALIFGKAMLPTWGWAIEQGEAAVWHPDTRGVSRDVSVNSVISRALLLAILRALEAEGRDNG